MRHRYPGLARRYLSTIIDMLCMLAGFFAISMIFQSQETPILQIRLGLCAILVLGYVPIMTAHDATLGQRLVGIRVRRFEDPSKTLPLYKAYLRLCVKAILGWLSFLTIGMNVERRAIHDKAASSVVIAV